MVKFIITDTEIFTVIEREPQRYRLARALCKKREGGMWRITVWADRIDKDGSKSKVGPTPFYDRKYDLDDKWDHPQVEEAFRLVVEALDSE